MVAAYAVMAAVNREIRNRQLRGQRSRRQLGQGQSFQTVFARNPFPLVDKVLLHASHKSDGPAKPNRPEPQKISNKTCQRDLMGLGLNVSTCVRGDTSCVRG